MIAHAVDAPAGKSWFALGGWIAAQSCAGPTPWMKRVSLFFNADAPCSFIMVDQRHFPYRVAFHERRTATSTLSPHILADVSTLPQDMECSVCVGQ